MLVNIGVWGDVSTGKTSVLRMFVRYLNKGMIESVEAGKPVSVVKTDFSGEATLPEGDKKNSLNEKETKTIHPNRVVFREDDTNKAHTIFAPGGEYISFRNISSNKERAVVINLVNNQVC